MTEFHFSTLNGHNIIKANEVDKFASKINDSIREYVPEPDLFLI